MACHRDQMYLGIWLNMGSLNLGIWFDMGSLNLSNPCMYITNYRRCVKRKSSWTVPSPIRLSSGHWKVSVYRPPSSPTARCDLSHAPSVQKISLNHQCHRCGTIQDMALRGHTQNRPSKMYKDILISKTWSHSFCVAVSTFGTVIFIVAIKYHYRPNY